MSERWKPLGIVLFALVGVYASPALPSAQPGKTLRIAAAADLEPVLPALITEFQRQTGTKVTAAYASSATLATQILNGGPFDLFLAADMSFPEKVIDAGLADSAEPTLYARGALVLWARKDAGFRRLDPRLTVEMLRNPAVGKVAVANPSHAPYGRAAMAAIRNLGLTSTLKEKLVVAENIAQTAQFAESGNAEMGLISLTSALTPRLAAEGSYVKIPPDSYPPILQGAVVMKNSSSRGQAHRFLEFLDSPSIRKQLAARGLSAP